jgi:hypothetical protein
MFSRPLTKEEASEKDGKRVPKINAHPYKTITCCECGVAGGTLVKIEEGKYQHQDSRICVRNLNRKKLSAGGVEKVFAMRKPVKGAKDG